MPGYIPFWPLHLQTVMQLRHPDQRHPTVLTTPHIPYELFLPSLIIPLRRRRQSGILSSNCPAGTAVP